MTEPKLFSAVLAKKKKAFYFIVLPLHDIVCNYCVITRQEPNLTFTHVKGMIWPKMTILPSILTLVSFQTCDFHKKML